jgi:hypothetical protein
VKLLGGVVSRDRCLIEGVTMKRVVKTLELKCIFFPNKGIHIMSFFYSVVEVVILFDKYMDIAKKNWPNVPTNSWRR